MCIVPQLNTTTTPTTTVTIKATTLPMSTAASTSSEKEVVSATRRPMENPMGISEKEIEETSTSGTLIELVEMPTTPVTVSIIDYDAALGTSFL